MIAVHDFIIYTDIVFNETFKTKGGLELYGDKRFLQKRLAQRIVEIKELPLNYEGEDIKGFQALIDITIFIQNNYDHGKGMNNEVIGHEGYYKIQSNMIIAVRENDRSDWIGFANNLLVEKIMEEEEVKKSILIILETPKLKAKKGFAKVLSINSNLPELIKGDVIQYNDNYGVDVFLEGKELLWIRVKDCLTKVM